jgi:hypothetical protein
VWLSVVRAGAARKAETLSVIVVVAIAAAVTITGYVVRRRRQGHVNAEGYLESMRRIVPSKEGKR